VQEVKCPDKAKRLHYSWLHAFIEKNGVDVLANVLFSDEAWLHLRGCVNNQNSRKWSSERKRLQRPPLHPKKTAVWCDVSCRRVVGHFSSRIHLPERALEYHNRIAVSLLEEDERECRFQQDGATKRRLSRKTFLVIVLFSKSCGFQDPLI
jgi:hypothetical protein